MEPISPGTGAAAASKTLRILVVDDHHDSALSMQMLIGRKHHDVEVAFDGAEALRRGEELKPRLVLLDLSLPGKDGHEIAREMRATKWGKSAVLAATTGWLQADRQETLEAVFDHYLTKPIEPDTLYRLLEAVAKHEPENEESGPAPLAPA